MLRITLNRKDMEKIIKEQEVGKLLALAADYQKENPCRKIYAEVKNDVYGRRTVVIQVIDSDYKTMSYKTYIVADRLVEAEDAFADVMEGVKSYEERNAQKQEEEIHE